MLYELSIHEVMTLQSALTSAQWVAAENAGAAERSAGLRHLPEAERDASAQAAKWFRKMAVDLEAVRKALDEGREITTLAQAKEALAR